MPGEGEITLTWYRALKVHAASPKEGLWASTLIVLIGNTVARGLGFLFPLMVARLVDRADFALVYLVINGGFLVAELILAGMPTALARFLAARDDDVPSGTWLTGALLAGVPLLAASMVLAVVVAIATDAPPILMVLIVLGLTVDAYYFSVLRGSGRFVTLAAYRISANVVQLVLLLAAVALDVATVPVIVAIYAFVYLMPIVVIELRVRLLRGMPGLVRLPAPAQLRSLVAFGASALVSGVAYGFLVGLDVVMVRLLAPAALADYGAARVLAMPMSLVPFAIGIVLLPRTAAAKGADRFLLLRNATLVAVAITAAGTLAYMVLSGPLVSLVYPGAYAASAGPLPWLAFALGLLGIYTVLSQWWMGIGRPGVPAFCLVVGASGALVAHLVLDVPLGALGAALSMLFGVTTALVQIAGAAAVHWWRSAGRAEIVT